MPGCHRRLPPDVRLHGGEQGGVRGLPGDRPGGGGTLDRRGLSGRPRARSRHRHPSRDRGRASPAGPRPDRPADHGGSGQHQVPRQGRERRRQARRAPRGPGGRGARLPASARGRAALGRGAGDGSEVARARPRDRGPGGAAGRGGPGLDPGPRGRAPPSRPRQQPGSAPGARPPATTLDGRTARAGPRLAVRAGPRHGPGRPGGPPNAPDADRPPCLPHRDSAPALRRLLASHAVPHDALRDRGDACDPGHRPWPARDSDAHDRAPRDHSGRRRARQPRRGAARSSWCFPFERVRRSALDAALDDIRDRYGSDAVTRAVLLGRDQGVAVPLLPD